MTLCFLRFCKPNAKISLAIEPFESMSRSRVKGEPFYTRSQVVEAKV